MAVVPPQQVGHPVTSRVLNLEPEAVQEIHSRGVGLCPYHQSPEVEGPLISADQILGRDPRLPVGFDVERPGHLLECEGWAFGKGIQLVGDAVGGPHHALERLPGRLAAGLLLPLQGPAFQEERSAAPQAGEERDDPEGEPPAPGFAEEKPARPFGLDRSQGDPPPEGLDELVQLEDQGDRRHDAGQHLPVALQEAEDVVHSGNPLGTPEHILFTWRKDRARSAVMPENRGWRSATDPENCGTALRWLKDWLACRGQPLQFPPTRVKSLPLSPGGPGSGTADLQPLCSAYSGTDLRP